MPEEQVLPVGHKIQWYTVQKVLGQGGFGVTYLARDTNLDQDVAIKEFLPKDLATRDDNYTVQSIHDQSKEVFEWGLDRFIKEAKTLAKFNHPNIVRVLSVFEANNTAYMVMNYEHGISFLDSLRQNKIYTEEELMNILLPLMDGLEVMHKAGFIHRDIKPGNIFVRENGTPLLLDFGSARQAIGEETKTLTKLVSPGYAPFEQYFGKSDIQGPWTDIYSLGATMYRAIIGEPPTDSTFRNRASGEKAINEMWETLNAHSDKYSITFLRAIEHSLRTNFRDRPQTISEWRVMFTDPSISTQTQWRMAKTTADSPKLNIKKLANWKSVFLILVTVLITVTVTIGILEYLDIIKIR